MPFAISPLSKNFSVSLPPKNCKIFGSIYFPSIFDFSNGPIVKSVVTLYLYTSQFLNDNAGLMENLLIS